MSDFEKYFDNKFVKLKPDIVDIDSLLEDDMTLIIGDFYGIQKFIFERLATKNASKVLRAKSAFIQIFTEYLAKYICNELYIDTKYILTQNAGKFEILAPKVDIDLSEIQNSINRYFLDNFYGLSGTIICKKECKREDYIEAKKYRKLREDIASELEKQKYKKFDLVLSQPVLAGYDTSITNNLLCPICNIRKIKNKNCDICDSFIELGKKLAISNNKIFINTKELGLSFGDNFDIEIELNEKIKSYILYIDDEKHNFQKPAEFSYLAKQSCNAEDHGIKALGILKADVDHMGRFLEESDITESFQNFDLFSKTVDNFFSIYVPNIMREKYPHTYTVFAGGDDLFLVGAWDEILALAKEIREEFKVFIKSKLSISFGIAVTKPSTPISYMAEHSEKLLEEAKAIDDEKDAISLFKQTVKWDSYNDTYKKLYPELEKIEVDDIKTSLLYRLLQFCQMKIEINEKIENALWRSKLNYMFSRNIDKKYHYLIPLLDEYIENHPKETKMVLSEFIYKRRKQ